MILNSDICKQDHLYTASYFMDIYYTQGVMIQPIDPRTKQFYMEMGYTEQQVIRAYEYSLKKQVDILDALANPAPSSQPQPPPQKKQQNNYIQPAPSSKSNNTSFLAPFSQIRAADYETLYSRSSKFNNQNSKYQLRQPNNPVGLLNISNCCYLNSLIQCYFLMDKFKEILLTAEPLDDISQLLADNKTKLKRVKNEYQLLGKLKRFFTVMSLTSKKYLDPSDVLQNLVDSVGQKLAYGEEKDLSEINIMIIERLSEGLTFSKKFFQSYEEPLPSRSSFIDEGQNKTRFNSIFNPEKGFIKQLFYGTKVEYYQQKQMEKQQPIVSDFTGIILNPRFGTLENALDEEFNFSVEMKGEYFKKQMFIRDEPEYLFMYINRTEYDREEQQMHKNDEKFVFDFVLYLDRYLEKYRKERDQKDERIRLLISDRNRVKEQISNLQILQKKMEECYYYANKLEGWEEKLPTVQEFQEEEARLNERLNILQQELQQIESRKEQYHLMYIFVHRGDAISGHYWGYGRNGSNWYRFDINCKLMSQEQIIIDMEKSSGTPYALLFVKKERIPQFKYNYHTKVDMKQSGDLFFYKNFDQKLSEEVIRENVMLHHQIQIKNNEAIKKKCFIDYVTRYNALNKAIKKFTKPKNEMTQLDNLTLCNNFSFFLHSKKEIELAKFTIFQQSLLFASANRVTIEKLMHEGDLLGRIQKKFKLKCKGELHLKNYAVVGKDLQKYVKYQEQYQFTIFEVAWALALIASFENFQTIIEKANFKQGSFVKFELSGSLGASLASTIKYLRIRNNFFKSEECQKLREHLNAPLYVSQVNNQITKLIALNLVVYGFKFESLQKVVELSDAAGYQIASINSYNSISTSALFESEPTLTLIEEMQEIVKKPFLSGRKSNTNESGAKMEKRTSTKGENVLTSPPKSTGFSKMASNSKKRSSELKLTKLSQNSQLLFDIRQTWKIEELQSARPNFDFAHKVMTFLKRSSEIVKLYKRTQQLDRALSAGQLREIGIFLNQSSEEQSLI